MTTLDAAARRLVEGARHPPFLYAMGPHDARLALQLLQAPPQSLPGLTHTAHAVATRHGPVTVHMVSPEDGPQGPLVLYAHGGGWMIGGYETHHRFATTLCRLTGATVVVPDYGLTPEFRHPVAVEQLADVLDAVRATAPGPIALAGDCAGATLALALALDDATPDVAALALLYPLGRPAAGDESAAKFATGAAVRLVDVQRLCRGYSPRDDPRADPLNAATVSGLPPTLIITAEADVTRDRAERFGDRLRAAGGAVTAVRYLGTIHDFAVLDALRWTPAARTAVAQVADHLLTAFGAATGAATGDGAC